MTVLLVIKISVSIEFYTIKIKTVIEKKIGAY